MRTTQEKRKSLPDSFYVRSKRNFKNLVCAWDDKIKSSSGEKSWKRQTKRKHQYKDKKE